MRHSRRPRAGAGRLSRRRKFRGLAVLILASSLTLVASCSSNPTEPSTVRAVESYDDLLAALRENGSTIATISADGSSYRTMTKTKDLHRKWRKDPGYQAAYDALEKEFHLARTLIETRTRAGLSQTQLARRMRTSQSYNRPDRGGGVNALHQCARKRLAVATILAPHHLIQ